MIIRQKIDLQELEQEAQRYNLVYLKKKDRIFISDAVAFTIATEEGAITIPLEAVPEFITELKLITTTAIQKAKEQPMEVKNEIAKDKGISYGKYKSLLDLAEMRCKSEET